MKSPFIIVSLPRSGTAWLSNMLTVGSVYCFHELSREFKTAAEIAGAQIVGSKATIVGNADSGALPYLPELLPRLPGARIIYVRRDKERALAAFCKASGLPREICAEPFNNLELLLESYSSHFPGLTVQFSDLFNEETVRSIWRHVAGEMQFPEWHYRKMKTLRVEQDETLIRKAASGWREKVLCDSTDATHDSTILAQ